MTAPAWFVRNIAQEPERGTIDVDGCSIETLSWGVRDASGLIFVHGNGAHADWWAPFAPFFSADYRVATLSLSGMGRSQWRERYSMDQQMREIMAVAEHSGVFASGRKPWLVAHSMDGIPATWLAASEQGGRFAGLILLDCAARPRDDPPSIAERHAWSNPGYAALEEGIARFRLRPTQPETIAGCSTSSPPNRLSGERTVAGIGVLTPTICASVTRRSSAKCRTCCHMSAVL